jgi:gluconolactonase
MENSRRDMLAGACAAAAMSFTSAALAAWESSQRYPDPAVQSLDPSFNKYRLALDRT